MRAWGILVVVALLAPLVAAVAPLPTQRVSVSGATTVWRGVGNTYSGAVYLVTPALPGLRPEAEGDPSAFVELYDDAGDLLATQEVGATGTYSASVAFPAGGAHKLIVHAYGAWSDAWSAPFNVTVLDEPGPVRDLQAVVASASTVTISWSPPASDGGSPITQYWVFRSVNGSALTRVANVPPGTLSVTDTVPWWTSIQYTVRAANLGGSGTPAGVGFITGALAFDAPSFYVCHAGACGTVANGTVLQADAAGPYTYWLNVTARTLADGAPAADVAVQLQVGDQWGATSPVSTPLSMASDANGVATTSLGPFDVALGCALPGAPVVPHAFTIAGAISPGTASTTALLTFAPPEC